MLLSSQGRDADVLVMRGKSQGGVTRVLRFWAERGLIHYEDSACGDFGSLSVAAFLRRVKALSAMLGNSSSKKDRGLDPELRAELQGYVDTAVVIAQKAREQGEPRCAQSRREAKRRAPKTVIVCGDFAM